MKSHYKDSNVFIIFSDVLGHQLDNCDLFARMDGSVESCLKPKGLHVLSVSLRSGQVINLTGESIDEYQSKFNEWLKVAERS